MTITVDIDPVTFDRAVARAQTWLRRQIASLPGIRDLRQLAEEMHRNELVLEELRARLEDLKREGIARATDYRAYETARANMYAMHTRFYRFLRGLFRTFPEIFGEIPTPKMAPKVTPGPASPEGVSGFRALGNPAAGAAAAGGAAAVSPWMLGGLVLVILAGAAVVITLLVTGALAEEVIRDVIVTREQLHTTRQMWEERAAVYQDCRDAGNSPFECGSTAQRVVPAPPEVLRELPRPGEWIKWAAIGAGVLIFGGIVWWAYSGWKGRRRGVGGLAAAPRFRELTPNAWLAGEGSHDYGMEDV